MQIDEGYIEIYVETLQKSKKGESENSLLLMKLIYRQIWMSLFIRRLYRDRYRILSEYDDYIQIDIEFPFHVMSRYQWNTLFR